MRISLVCSFGDYSSPGGMIREWTVLRSRVSKNGEAGCASLFFQGGIQINER